MPAAIAVDCPSASSTDDDSSSASVESPYMRRKVRTKRAAATVLETQQQRSISPTPSPFVFDFGSAQHSPYSQRRPATDRREAFHNNADWTNTSSSEMEDNMPKGIHAADSSRSSHEHIALPVELHRHQSMASLRSRRDPHYQGVRSRRARRVIDKMGERNINFLNIPHRSWLFMKDFVTTLIDCQWRLVITLFALSFFLCWLLFAMLWFLIAHAHGDLDFDPVTGVRLNDGTATCVEGAYSFAGFLLLSIETQVSIGFGNKYPNEECPEAVFLMVVQIVCGIALEGAMVGIVYAKMSRPSDRARSRDMKFSRRAVVCQRDGRLCLVFRVCDVHARHVIDTRVQAYWFEEKCSSEGERLRQFQHSLKLENDGRVFLIFPTVLCHVIDAQSPLYDLSAKDLLEKRFELIITLNGSSRSTGQMTQSRTSYLPKEVLWGYRFENLTSFDRLNDTYLADYDKFDSVLQVDTPLCSARRLGEVLEDCRELVKRQEAQRAEEDARYAEVADSGEASKLAGQFSSTQSSDYFNPNAQNIDNQERTVQYRHLERLAEELEYRLSNHSLHFEQGAMRDGMYVIDASETQLKESQA